MSPLGGLVGRAELPQFSDQLVAQCGRSCWPKYSLSRPTGRASENHRRTVAVNGRCCAVAVSHDENVSQLGLFTEDCEHRFALTRLGEPLKTGSPGSVRVVGPDFGRRGLHEGARPFALLSLNGKTGLRESLRSAFLRLVSKPFRGGSRNWHAATAGCFSH
jgi:hypothetical protein